MNVPRKPRHALDNSEEPAATDAADSPTEALPMVPMIPRQRVGSHTAGPPVAPVRLRGTHAPEPPPASWYGGTPGASAAGTPPPFPAPSGVVPSAPRRRGRMLPVLLAGATAVLLGLGIAAVTVQSGPPAEAASSVTDR